MANLNNSLKCLFCYSPIQTERPKNPAQFTLMFDTLCELLNVEVIKSMKWNFYVDPIPFCQFCSAAVEKLYEIQDQIADLQMEEISTLNRLQHEIQTSTTSSSDTNETTADDKVKYFRRLIFGAFSTEEDGAVNAEITSFNVECVAEVETQIDRHNNIEFPFQEGINESCQFEDADIQIDSLLTVKHERDGLTDCVVDVESFLLDNMDFQEVESRPEEINQIDFEIVPLLTVKREDDTAIDCNEMSKSCEIVNNERKLDINLTRFDVQLEENEPGVNYDKINNLCEECEKGDESSKKFSNIHSLTCYKRIHTGEMKYKCDHCNKMYGRRYQLVEHRRNHTGEIPYTCEVCLKTFTTEGSLTVHKRKHSGKISLECDICKNIFKTLSGLTMHQRIHTGEKRYKCDVCNKCFVQSGPLKDHVKIHTGEKPYKCDVCLKTFRTRGNFSRHKKLHTGEKRYKCNICNIKFSHSRQLTVHKKTHK